MKPHLRFLLLLLAWTALGRTVAWAAPIVAYATSVTPTGNSSNAFRITSLVAAPDNGQTISNFTLNNVPADAQGGRLAYPVNADGTGGLVVATNGATITQAQANNLYFAPATGFSGAVANGGTFNTRSFTFTANQSNGATTSADYLVFVASYNTTNNNYNLTGADQTAVNIPNVTTTSNATALPALTATTNNGTAIAGYRLLTLPANAAGTLYVNGTAATVNQNLTAAQAAQLTFVPSGNTYQGAPFFAYSAYTTGGVAGYPGFYTLPVSKSGNVLIDPIDLSRRTAGEDWKANGSVTANATTLTRSGYTTSVLTGNTNTFAIGDNAILPGPALVWQLNPQGVNPATTVNQAQTTFTFDRAVTSLSLTLTDIDRDIVNANFIDEFDLNAYATDNATTPLALSTNASVSLANAGVNTLVANTNTIRGTGTSNADANSTVVVTFSSPVKKLVLTFRNTAPYVDANTDRTHTMGITSLTWLAQADLTTTLTGPGSLSASLQSGNYTVTYTNNGPEVAASTTRTVTIPNTGNVASVSAPGATSVAGSATTNWVITYPVGTNVAAGSGGTVSYTFTLTPSLTSTGNTITATSNTLPGAGGTDQGVNTATDAASSSYVVGAVADVGVSFSSGQANNSTVTAGTTVTYGVTFTNAGPSTASNVTRTVSIPAGVPSVTAATGTVSGSAAAGWTITYPGGSVPLDATGTTYSFSYVAPATGPVTITANTTTSTNQGANTSADAATRTLNVTPVPVSGTVYDDINYGGGSGRTYATANSSAIASGLASGAIGRPNATVEFYNSAGTFVGSTTTTSTGTYAYNLPAAGTYTVRVVNSTVTSARTPSATGLVPVQTYVFGNTERVGGENPAYTDAAANTGSQTLASLTPSGGTVTPESIYTATFGTTATTGVDFGFNFDAIVNTSSSGQGSLAQFILNSNAIGNETNLAPVYTGATTTALTPKVETSIFMIPNGAQVPGQRAGLTSGFTTSGTGGGSGSGATITLSATLPNITGPATVIDGSTQTRSTGDSNLPVTTAGTESLGPEVTVNFNGNNGFSTSAANTSVLNMGFTGSAPGGGSTTAAFSILAGATGASVQGNTFYFNGSNLRINGVGGATISGNISRDAQASNSDGIEVTGSSNNTISSNLFSNNAGFGIDFISGTSTGNNISGNTFKTNGQNTSNGQTAGIGIRSSGVTDNTISTNTFVNNLGAGIIASTGNNNVFTQNSFANNGRLAIDLSVSTITDFNGDGVTVNDLNDADTGANGLINFPILTTATLNGTNLVVNGYARPGALVELYLATADPTGFGEGTTYLTNFTQGTAAGTTGNVTTGTASTYGPAAINGLNQGTDNTNTFAVTIPLSSLTSAQRTALLSGAAVLTSTATSTNVGTSEFSGNLTLPVADVTTALTGPQTVSPGQPTGTYTATFTNEGPSTASSVTRTVTLPAGATSIIVNGSPYTPASTALNTIDFGTATTLNSGVSNAFTFSFIPAATATATTGTPSTPGTVAITSNVTTSTSQGSNAAPDASTLNAAVAPVTDVATTLVATTSAVAAGTLGTATTPPTFTVTFSNTNGPSVASGVVAAVQLPTGLTNVKSTNNTNGVYNAATGVLTFPDITTIAVGGSTSSVITFDAPAAGPLVANSTISTTTNEAGLTANNKASATMTVTPAFDLTTTITGPTSAVIGDLVTLAVTTTNNGPSAAPNAVQTVQLASGLTNVYVSNGGVYNAATSTQTITVNGVSYSVPAGAVIFPTIASLPSGQTVANSISFSQPGTALSPVATVTPNTASNATTAGDTNTANNTAYLNANPNSTPVAILNPQQGTANAYTTITTSAASTTVGSPVTLTVTTGNRGFNQATGVTQTVQLAPGFTTTTIKVNGITGTLANNVITFGTNGPTYNTLNGIVTFPTLTDGSNGSASATSVTNTIAITPSAATATTVATTGTNGQLLAMAAVSTTNTDPVPADNVSSVAITLVQSTDLATSITGPTSAVPGQSVTYTASFTNNGPMTATGVTESAQLPAGLGTNGVTITDGAGNAVSGASYSSTTGLVTFPTLATDISGATQVFKLTFAAPAQNFAPSSSVNSSSADAVGANNTASVATTVPATADLATTVAGPATAVVGNAVTYTVNTTNNGPAVASSAVTTLQLVSGFSPSTLQVNGVTGTAGTGNLINYNLGTAGTATYNTASGLVTFPTLAYLPVGATSSNYVSFVMPNAAGGQTTGVASASATGTDPVPNNNSASVATSIAPTTTTSADLTATVTAATVPANATAVAPGSTVTYTATYGNIGTDAGINVLPTLQLIPGLTTTTLPSISGATGTAVANSNLINYNLGAAGTATYNTTTGLVTFPTIASQATGAANNVSYTVQVIAPSNGPLLATAVTTSNTSEPSNALTNNFNSVSVGITPSFNEVTSISGPASALAGTSQTYTVTATNNGPSATSNPTTQSVTVPSGQTPTNITNGGVYSSTANTITWTIAAGQASGANGAVANSFTIVQPTAGVSMTASVQVTGESNTGDNTAPISTTVPNRAPLAYAVVNALQNPQSNEAGGLATGLLISPLNASDPENSFATAKYTVVTIPTNVTGGANNQGVLYFSNDGTTTGTYSAVVAGQTLTDAQAQTLRFKAATGFVGNASFTYLTTDAAGNASPTVSYTIPVESDVDARSYTLTPAKGGTSGAYTTGDVIAFTTDANGAVYNATTASVYQPNGTLQTGASAGIASASPVAGSFTSSRAGVTSLADIGLSVDATGRIVVSNPGTVASPNLRSGSYSVAITTIDGNGGVTTQTVSFVIPGSPLPVVLTAFTATAVQNRDTQLSWTTASEENSAYFDLERSFDGTSFVKVGQVAAQGTSTSATTYAFTDKGVASLATGAVYYRLKQVDRDATATYSPVRTVSFTKAAVATLSLYPNPAQNATTLDLSQLPTTGTYQVLVLDATGRQVRAASLGGGLAQSLDLHELATGTYHVLVTGTLADGSALRQTLRLTKE
ncbi:right-handed parallel beta-helix repeat-containing protein [Hymenobacter cheonanensis]|uniref:right-handed parallel beta-helix repeat-containing protein n=1 Tax=Hymenobacter sp. CA2-7 TaxID=3063993 RepID=UPI002712E001|nr:right-handed parallel beta-helix repeat-containing protein [Hymenobacter sp. CA2-7]MDO7884970.1 right-handed parallel beta-helix repeat-containing protein [Hymenobacter sp. CA2-7]